jgi:mono/diheme cytochrome c family protein
MRYAFVMLTCLFLMSPALADMQRGADLHANNCVACHDKLMGGDGNALYKRADRRIQSLPALEQQVRRCKDNLGLVWFDDQVQDVADYLNATFYKFTPGS